MAMPMMKVRVVWMGVTQWRVRVPMRVRFADRPVMRVLVMHVVRMSVLVFERLMRMLVFVALGEVHP